MSATESIEEAVASTRLEGLDLSPEFLADADALESGEIDLEEFRTRTLDRHRP
ncbi:MAG: antitoxin VbhA family protein [Hyphomicrobiales bacterium]|nr:antitoxin VbhA family protein [Hyphomicrobiales bacterium]